MNDLLLDAVRSLLGEVVVLEEVEPKWLLGLEEVVGLEVVPGMGLPPADPSGWEGGYIDKGVVVGVVDIDIAPELMRPITC